MRKKAIFVIILAILAAPGCGKKGPLTLEPEKLPTQVENFAVKQIGEAIVLEWGFPQLLSDSESQPDPALIKRIYIYHATNEIKPEKFRKKASLIKKLQLSDLTVKADGTYSLKIDFNAKKLANTTHYFGVLYYYGKKRSPMGNIQTIKTIDPVRPIDDLFVTREQKVLKLNWNKPFLNSSNTKIEGLSGYRVYRKVISTETDSPEEFSEISKDKVLREYFEDVDTGIDGDYSYYVTVLSSDNIFSAKSNIVTIKVTDTYPPDSPVNLVVFKAKDHMFLTWEKVKDKDFSYYNVYKSSSNSQEGFEPIATKVSDNYFKDNKVKTRVTFYYYITAVDEKGNESKRSNLVKEKF